MSYDQACYDLARHFLGDLPSEKLASDLAQHIQTTIEDWLEYGGGVAICPDCKGERRVGGKLCIRCNGCAQIGRSELRPGEKGAFE